ncbi:MAG: lipoyl(octanoyl) transferase LipB [Ginsengibacter sp.]
MEKQHIIFEDLGIINYKAAWDYQEKLVKKNLEIKSEARRAAEDEQSAISIQHSAISIQQSASSNKQSAFSNQQSGKKNSRLDLNNELTEDFSFTSSGKKELSTSHHLLFCEHPPVYTLGKSGHIENVLLSEHEMEEKEIEFFRTNRGGDITFHGLQQVVGYPILDLEKFTTDIGEYLHRLEEVIIVTIADYGIKGDRSKGETGVWIEPGNPGRERKICAMGIRCSRWITMHGFALNVNTDLSYFDNIIPCGIVNKQVTSIEKELGYKVNFEEVKEKLKRNFEVVFNASLS